MGLLSVPTIRDRRSYRRYGPDAVAELEFVRRCKALGLSLKEIAVLVHLRRAARGSCARLHEQLSTLRSQLVTKSRQLEAQLAAVKDLLDACSEGKPIGECEAFARLTAAPRSAER